MFQKTLKTAMYINRLLNMISVMLTDYSM